MAFFKSRAQTASHSESVKDDAQSLDSLRKQARHRLIGATVLVLIAVLGFPVVFDTKPREISADIRIDMPQRESVSPTQDRKSTRLNSSHSQQSRMPSSA